MATTAFLRERRRELSELLLAREPVLMREYLDVQVALAAIEAQASSPDSFEYAGFRQAILGIEHFLRKIARPASRKEIIEALLSGGFDLRGKRREYNVRDALRYHTQSVPPRLILSDELYSLPVQQEDDGGIPPTN